MATPGSAAIPSSAAEKPAAGLIRSVRSGPWSAAATWEGSKVPGAGARVQVREGHTVVYDVKSGQPIRLVHVAGTLTFARDRDTRLDAGLIKIQPGNDASEDGFDCGAHLPDAPANGPRPALEVGTPGRPIEANHTAVIRLVDFDGVDKNSWPAIVCCGGRMEFHGAPLNRTWVKLGKTARKDDATVTLAEPVQGWRVGDRVILTATKPMRSGEYRRNAGETEERIVKAIEGTKLTLDKPLEYEHHGDGEYRGEVANLSRNVVVESAERDKARGHTMYHRGSAGSIRYAEFRHLGKENTLGRYSLHFHLAGDTMRGSSVIGASIWDSGNRWITIHGTNYLVVRDCVGYKSIGHGFFLEDGTEVYNVLVFENIHSTYNILIPITHYNGSGSAVSHFRNVKLVNWSGSNERALANMYGGKWLLPPTPRGVPIYFHDYFGPNRHAKVVSARAADLLADGNAYREVPFLTGAESRAAEVHDVEFPNVLDPADDLPPATVITHTSQLASGKLLVRGTTSDNGAVKKVLVNGREAKATAGNFAEWEVVLDGVKPGKTKLSASAEDATGNVEKLPHTWTTTN